MKTPLLTLLLWAAPLFGQAYIAIDYPPGLVHDSCSGDTCEVTGSKAGFCTTADGSFVKKAKVAVAMVAGVVNCTEGYAYYGIDVAGFAILPDGTQGYDNITGVAGAGQLGINIGEAIATDSCNRDYFGSGRFVHSCIQPTCGDGSISTQEACPPPPCDPTDPTGNCFCDPTDPNSSCYVPPCDPNNLTDYTCHIPCTEGDCPSEPPPCNIDAGCGPGSPPYYPPCDPNDPTCNGNPPVAPNPCDLDPTLCGPPVCDPSFASCSPSSCDPNDSNCGWAAAPSCDPADPSCNVPPGCDDTGPDCSGYCDPNDPSCSGGGYCDPNDPACVI